MELVIVGVLGFLIGAVVGTWYAGLPLGEIEEKDE